eukprot:COSAG01_NODE_2089_length_8454_cov_12.054339_11_plen_109_part_00
MTLYLISGQHPFPVPDEGTLAEKLALIAALTQDVRMHYDWTSSCRLHEATFMHTLCQQPTRCNGVLADSLHMCQTSPVPLAGYRHNAREGWCSTSISIGILSAQVLGT